jgi:Rieske Fe-S protein
MTIQALSEHLKITKAGNASAAGVTAVNSDAVDMLGYDGVLLFVAAGAITAGGVQSVKAQVDTVSNFASPEDLAGTAIAIADDDDNQIFVLDIQRPPQRYVRLVISRATQNSAFGEIYAIRYKARSGPQANSVTDTSTVEVHADPVVGTA